MKTVVASAALVALLALPASAAGVERTQGVTLTLLAGLKADVGETAVKAESALEGAGFTVLATFDNGVEVPAEVRRSVELWIGCLAGALEEKDFEARLKKAGFTDVEIVPTRIYTSEDARDFLLGIGAAPAVLDGKFMSAFVRATKPAA